MILRRQTLSVGITAALLLTASFSYADKAWDQYLGLSKLQRTQLNAANQARNGSVKPAQQDKDSATQNLKAQVLANAGDAVIQPIFSQILGDIKTIDGAEENFWSMISGSLTPTQVAKIFLKNHPPKNPASAPPPAQHPPHPLPPYNWNAYFGFTKDLQTQLKSADQAKNTQMKNMRDEIELAAEQLNQLVQSNAADSSIQPTLTTLFSDFQTEHTTEQAFWGTTLSGFLSPTQVAKLYLHRHPPKGGFTPPPPAVMPTH